MKTLGATKIGTHTHTRSLTTTSVVSDGAPLVMPILVGSLILHATISMKKKKKEQARTDFVPKPGTRE